MQKGFEIKNFMKKILIVSSFLCFAFSASIASINGNGYYRVQNFNSERFASLRDNKENVDFMKGYVNVHSLVLKNFSDSVLFDPGSIVYIAKLDEKKFNMGAQGVTLGDMIGHQIFIGEDGSSGSEKLYRIWGTYEGVTRYLSDSRAKSDKDGNTKTADDGTSRVRKQWKFLPVDVNSSNNYFGVVPTHTINGKLYACLFTSFPYKPVSKNVKVYNISKAGWGILEMSEITGVVPAGVPVIVECAGKNVADNKLELINSSPAMISNVLSGVYFNYKDNNYENRVKYDPNTMRVLGTCKDGSLGFITDPTLDYIPRNTAYLSVIPGAPAEYKCLDPAAYTAGIDTFFDDDVPELRYDGLTVYAGKEAEIRIYNMAGSIMASSRTGSVDVANLPKGIYIATSQGKSIKIVH